ncbi:hypothetical protein CGQ24_06655 [Arthrobacter sp. 7749]|nr:hypothetical protein CGQ24_06655 [Arthrobacter sp. 7749]
MRSRRSGARSIPALALVAVLGAALAMLPHVRVVSPPVVAMAQAVLPILLIGALVLSLILCLRRAFIAAAILLVFGGLALLPLLPQAPARDCSDAAQLSVLSLNAGRGNAEVRDLAEAIRKTDPTVLVLVETSEPMIEALKAELVRGAYRYRTESVVFGGSVDTVILSTFPLSQEPDAVSQVEGALFDAPVALIQHPDLGPLRIAGIHPIPPTHGATSWAATLHGIDAWQLRQDATPLILAGDFNATRAHPQFRELADHFQDAVPLLGPLPAGTWPADIAIPAMVRIDHILVRGFAPTEATRIDVSGTDHHGIVARLAVCR